MALAITLLASIAAPEAGAVPRSPEDPMEQRVLRLHDLPPGYYPLDFSEGSDLELICEPLDPADPQPTLASFIRRFSPEGCMGLYLRLYRIPGVVPTAQLVGTGALDAGSVTGAEAGFPLAEEILGLITEDEVPTEAATTVVVGDATRMLHWPRVPSFFGKGYRRGSFLVWRSGKILATAFASASSLEASDQIVEELARRQQAHIEDPTPYTRAERNASEVGLDDPALKLPVYWLGRNFDPGRGLPVARLEWGGSSRHLDEELPGQKLQVQYSKGLVLSSWTKAGWRRFLTTPRGREIFAEPCLESVDLSIPAGSATIYTGHVAGFRPCLTGSPQRFFAVAHLGDTVVAVRLSGCLDCPEPPRSCRKCRELRLSYNSLAGMKAAARALQLRPEPDY